MLAKIDITGQRFGRLVAMEPTKQRKNGNVIWKCLCDCGKSHYVRLGDLKNSSTKSCGCLSKELSSKRTRKDITNKRFGRLVALGPTDRRYVREVIWECICDCGKVCFVVGTSLRLGHTKSCGCFNSASLFARGTNIDPMDVPFEVIRCMQAKNELRKAIKQVRLG